MGPEKPKPKKKLSPRASIKKTKHSTVIKSKPNKIEEKKDDSEKKDDVGEVENSLHFDQTGKKEINNEIDTTTNMNNHENPPKQSESNETNPLDSATDNIESDKPIDKVQTDINQVQSTSDQSETTSKMPAESKKSR